MGSKIIFFSGRGRGTLQKKIPQKFMLICLPRQRVKWRAGKAMCKPLICGEHSQRMADNIFYPWQIWWLTGRYGPNFRSFTGYNRPDAD